MEQDTEILEKKQKSTCKNLFTANFEQSCTVLLFVCRQKTLIHSGIKSKSSFELQIRYRTFNLGKTRGYCLHRQNNRRAPNNEKPKQNTTKNKHTTLKQGFGKDCKLK